MRRPFSRFIVLVIFLGAGALFYWQQENGPVETPVAFVLTDLEVVANNTIYRYEHVKSLTVDFIDESGDAVAQISHRRPGAVAKPPPVRLPKATYSLRITLKLERPNSPPVTRNYLRTQELAGEAVSVRL
ncbi:MAG: hypothetical protein ACI9OJ_003815 [Myxococcota bacterium]|jgi:hypothetical protein